MADRHDVLTVGVDPISAVYVADMVVEWTTQPQGRVVCAANVHMVMEAWDDPAFARDLRKADLVVCDGRPLVWACRLDGLASAEQARGLDMMLEVCAAAARDGLVVGLYGGRPDVAATVARRLQDGYPGLRLSYVWSPPFRPLDDGEDAEVVAAIKAAGVRILFVGLGCPKQERWMMAHSDRLPCVMLGVGAAFDFIGGDVSVSPRWMQVAGLEWVYRLAQEPQRLWRRYARHNLRFVVLVGARRLSRPRP